MALQNQTFSYGSLSYQSESNAYVLDLIVTEEAVDTAANTSLISYKLQLRSGPSNRFNGYVSAAVTLGGSRVAYSEMVTIAAAYNATYVLLTGTATVEHDPDGSCNLAAQGAVTMLGETASNPYAPPDMTAGGTMALTAIPRASTLAASAAFIGDAATIAVARKSADYTHSIHYSFGSLSGYLADAAGAVSDTEVRLTDTTILFPLPESFYSQIPHAPSGVCTLTCTTYLGDTQIGEKQTAVFTVTADPARCGPTLSGTARDVNEATLGLTGSEKTIVLGQSAVQCELTAAGRQGATVTALYVNGQQIDGTAYTMENAPTATIVFRAVDSRGYSAEYTVPGLTAVDYTPLSFYLSAQRTDPTSGEATLTVTGKWFGGTFGLFENMLALEYQVDGGDGAYFEPAFSGGDFTATVPLTGLDYQTSHTVTVCMADALSSLTKAVTIGRGLPVFDWGAGDVQFHVPVYFVSSDGTRFRLELQDGVLTAVT